ncbi:MAG: Gfo/Idh/MocA family oxidoreductase [Chloroflexota bacterium]|nr:Gfo/Idh/MocA family oxidoreductase [Chloroflexota bacterium]
MDLRSAVIGLGLLGTNHAAYFQGSDKTELVAAAEIREEAAEEAEERFGIKVYSDYDEMLAKEELDLVMVATPDPFHREPVVASAEAGVPYIVTQKPFATTVEDAQAMLEACDEAGSKLWVYLSNRVNPMDIATRYVIQEGLIGRVVYGEARLDDNISVPRRLWGERSKAWASSSSTAQFLLSHVSDTMRWFFEPAEVEAVYSISQREVLEYTPDLFDAYLFFDNGMKIRVKSDWIKYMEKLVEYYKCIEGEHGTIFYNKIPGFNVKEQSWQVNFSDRMTVEELLAHQEILSERGCSVHVKMHQPIESVGGGIMPQLEMDASQPQATELMDHILASIEEDKAVPSTWEGNGRLPTGQDGLMQTKIVSAIIESAEIGKEIEVS